MLDGSLCEVRRPRPPDQTKPWVFVNEETNMPSYYLLTGELVVLLRRDVQEGVCWSFVLSCRGSGWIKNDWLKEAK